MRDAVIVSAARTAVGKAPRGGLRETPPEELAMTAVREAIARAPGLDPAEVEDLILGCAMPEGAQGLNIARHVALGAGLPVATSAMTVNRFCASGLQALALATQSVASGTTEVADRRRARVDELRAHDRLAFRPQPGPGRALAAGLPQHGPHRGGGRPPRRRHPR